MAAWDVRWRVKKGDLTAKVDLTALDLSALLILSTTVDCIKSCDIKCYENRADDSRKRSSLFWLPVAIALGMPDFPH